MTFKLMTGGGLAFALGLAAFAPAQAATRKIDYNRDIRPILSDNCYACHGPDEKARKAKLRLDVAESALAKKAVVPKDLKLSELWSRVTTKDAKDLMPPPESKKKPLKPEQLALLKQWIEEGANYQGHWSFVPPAKTQPPATVPREWLVISNQSKGSGTPALNTNHSSLITSPIDRFVAAKLAERKRTPNPEASREVLIRRVSFDLTGLPPTPAEVDAFLADKSPNAYEKVVDRLLASPHYGEHMGRIWLDAARYGDTHGMHLDNERSMWPYRDWVVRAFNRNLPFDQFTIEQLAGDLLPNATQDQLIATGFNRFNVTTGEGGSINEEWIFRYAVDRTETMASVWMGLTAGCAVCHDHKYDPISSRDFYSMYAFFYSNADPAMDGNALLTAPTLKLTSPEQQKKLDDFNAQIAAVDKRIKAELTKVVYADPSTLNPPPPVKKFDTVWVDDDFPAGAKVEAGGAATTTKWVTAQDGKVLAGKRALKRTDPGVGQDLFSDLKTPFTIPPNGKVFLNVFLDPQDPPKAVMLQFNTGNWSHRAVWGDLDAIDFGQRNTNERKRLGELPKLGEWVKLEFAASQLGFKAGDQIKGLAFTLFRGTVYWDNVGITGETNPSKDPNESLAVWLKANQGKALTNVPDDVKRLFRSVKAEDRKPEENQRLREYYFELVCNTTRPQFEKLHAEKNPIAKARDDFDKAIPATFIWKDLEKPRDSFVMLRGQYNKPGAQVWPNVPAVLPPLLKSDSTNRLDLAKWLVSPQHPLTARVAVNRFWQQLFGTGLVKTAADFGAQGEAPSHPELLDWLAVTFREQGWDMMQFM
ncbi:MAG: PSD1 and planctomycete cytochrome C domain-containing protein [Limisphaerales bacterium]